jgi:MGT family glycosyltransferase
VYLTLGTVVFPVHLFGTVIDAFASLEVDAVVTVGPQGDPAALGPVPGNVRVERFVPQDALTPFVDLAVHHCGSGTLLGLLAAGLPSLGLPMGADQFDNAEALVHAGAGRVLQPEEVSVDAVAAGVVALLEDSSSREAAARLRDEIAAMPPPSAVVPQLEQLAAGPG